MSAVGFDVGNESSVIAITRAGIIEVVDNEVSNRRTPTVVGYQPQERNIGESGLSTQSSNAKHTITEIKRLIGRKFSNPCVQHDLSRFMYNVQQGENDKIIIQTQSSEGVIRLSPEQIFAAFLTQLRITTERKVGGQRVKDCVIACPPFYTQSERQALLDAANIAGLHVLRVMNETTAIALNYGILRTLPKENPIKVVFIDIGHASTNVAVVLLQEGKLEVLGTASDRELGGRDIDAALVEHFANEFVSKYKIDVKSKAKAVLRLAKASAKLKTVLSANKEASLNVESIMNDIDVRSYMKRDDLEAMIQPILDRVLKPCEEALRNTKTDINEIHSVEIVGGGTRVPAIRTRLEAFFGKPLSQTLNGDETVARGCALQCAMISPAFKVRNFEVLDISEFPIQMCWGPIHKNYANDDAEFKDVMQVFNKGNPVPSIKAITFHDREPFQIVLRYEDRDSLPAGTDRFISRNIIHVPPTDDTYKKIKVTVELDIHGMALVSKAVLYTEYEELVEEEIPVETTTDKMDTESPNSKSPKSGGDSEASPNTENGAAPDVEDTPMQNGDDSAPNAQDPDKMDTSNDGKPASPAPEKKKTRMVTKKRRDKKPLRIEAVRNFGCTNDELKEFFEKEVQFTHQDRLVAETAEKRNELESYVYDVRGKVEYDLKEFETEENRANFLKELQETEDWLYEIFDVEPQKSEYVRRLVELRKKGDKIEGRKFEFQHRDEEIGLLKSSVVRYQMFLQSCEEGEEKYSHISEEDREKVKKECDENDMWISQSLQKQDKKQKFEDPVFTCAEVRQKKTALDSACNSIVNKPKPAPKKEEKPAAEEGNKGEKAEEEKAPTGEETENSQKTEVDDMDVD